MSDRPLHVLLMEEQMAAARDPGAPVTTWIAPRLHVGEAIAFFEQVEAELRGVLGVDQPRLARVFPLLLALVAVGDREEHGLAAAFGKAAHACAQQIG